MQRQRGSLVPVAEVVSGSNGPVKAIRDASPQARHHFTRTDQVDQLVSAREAEAERGFMARTMALCSLPRANPGKRHQYKRVNGPYKLIMIAGGDNKLPFGNIPRLLMAWASTCTSGWFTEPFRFALRSGSLGGRSTVSSEWTRPTPAISKPFKTSAVRFCAS